MVCVVRRAFPILVEEQNSLSGPDRQPPEGQIEKFSLPSEGKKTQEGRRALEGLTKNARTDRGRPCYGGAARTRAAGVSMGWYERQTLFHSRPKPSIDDSKRSIDGSKRSMNGSKRSMNGSK
jgi:hypothetical protein